MTDLVKHLVLLALLLAPAATSAAPSLEPGQSFPVLSLPLCGKEGKNSSIETFRDRKLMLHLFASW